MRRLDANDASWPRQPRGEVTRRLRTSAPLPHRNECRSRALAVAAHARAADCANRCRSAGSSPAIAREAASIHEPRAEPVQYMILIYESPADFAARQTGEHSSYRAAWRAYHQALLEAGAHVGGAPLQDVSTATTVRSRDGKQLVQDGPFAEAKEQLGG